MNETIVYSTARVEDEPRDAPALLQRCNEMFYSSRSPSVSPESSASQMKTGASMGSTVECLNAFAVMTQNFAKWDATMQPSAIEFMTQLMNRTFASDDSASESMAGSDHLENQSVTPSKSRRRRRARLRRARQSGSVPSLTSSVVSREYKAPPDLQVQGYCYLKVIAGEHRERLSSALGSWPTFQQLMTLNDSDYAEPSVLRMLTVVRVDTGVYHVQVGSGVPLVDAFHAVAFKHGLDLPTPFGERSRNAVSEVMLRRSPAVSDCLGGDMADSSAESLLSAVLAGAVKTRVVAVGSLETERDLPVRVWNGKLAVEPVQLPRGVSKPTVYRTLTRAANPTFVVLPSRVNLCAPTWRLRSTNRTTLVLVQVGARVWYEGEADVVAWPAAGRVLQAWRRSGFYLNHDSAGLRYLMSTAALVLFGGSQRMGRSLVPVNSVVDVTHDKAGDWDALEQWDVECRAVGSAWFGDLYDITKKGDLLVQLSIDRPDSFVELAGSLVTNGSVLVGVCRMDSLSFGAKVTGSPVRVEAIVTTVVNSYAFDGGGPSVDSLTGERVFDIDFEFR